MIFEPITIVQGNESNFAVPLYVQGDPSAIVIAISGDDYVEGVINNDGEAILILPGAGIWSVYTTLGGVSTSIKTVEIPNGPSLKFSIASRLPDGYVELAYIDSAANPGDANAFFSTGISIQPSKSPRIVADFEPMLKSGEASVTHAVLASRNSDASTYYTVGISFGNSAAASTWTGLRCYYRSKSTTYYYNIVSSDTTPRRCKIDWDILNKIITLNGEPMSGTVKGPTSLTYAPVLYFPASGSTSSGLVSTGAVRLYSLQIYIQDQLEGDFVPCRDPNGVVGVYNLVTSTFTGSAVASIPFIAGPEV